MSIMLTKHLVHVFLLYLLFFLLPYYATDSGNIQPADIVLLIIFLYYLANRYKYSDSFVGVVDNYALLIFLLGLQLVILLGHVVISSNPETLQPIEYTLYGILVFVSFYAAFKNLYQHNETQRFYDIIFNCLLFSFVLPLGFFIFHPVGILHYRMALTFNNPNQVVFFCLMNISITYYLTLLAKKNDINCSKIKMFVLLQLNLLLIFLSVSRAGMSLIILYAINMILLMPPIKNKTIRMLVILIQIGLCLFLIYYIYTKLYNYMSFIRSDLTANKLKTDFVGRTTANLSKANYDLVAFFFGSGLIEGIQNQTQRLELHNNFTGIFYQTGIFSLLMYVFVCCKILFDLFKKGILYSLPCIIYVIISSAHYTFRTKFGWIFLAFTIFICKSNNVKKIHTLEN